jgi:putative PIN family toxin of toxin-antitoxin system
MVVAVVDTNVLVSAVLTSSTTSASRRLLDRHRAGDFVLVLSPSALQEIQEVLALPHLRKLHQLSDDEIRVFCLGLELNVNTRVLSGTVQVSPAITRDVTDTKWVALALEADADYLVTKDRRHLQRLRKVGTTRIVTPHKFLEALGDPA